MKSIKRVIVSAMAAVMAATALATNVSAKNYYNAEGQRILSTGEVITEELVDRYAEDFKSMHMSRDVLAITVFELGFYYVPDSELIVAPRDYEGCWIDYWRTLQRSKLRQHREGLNFLDHYSKG